MRGAFAILFLLISIKTFAADAEDLVRVRISARQNEIVLTGMALQVQGQSEKFQTVAIPKFESLRIRRFVRQGQSFWLVSHLPRGRAQVIAGPVLAIEGQGLRQQSTELPRQILLSPVGKTKIDLIAVLPLSEYLTGVLASEMPLSWPLETLKAQAVAARSYTLAVMKERKFKAYHVESSVLDQVFRHVVLQDNDPLIRKASLAVKATEKIRILDSSGEILKAFYHSDCGGRTVSAKNVWDSRIETGEATDESCPANPKAHWQISIRKEDLYAKIKKFLALNEESQIEKLEFVSIPHEERLHYVQVRLRNGNSQRMNGNDFRALIGFEELKSNLFSVQESTKDLTFTGRGFGHGVGLCQWGSRSLGLQGKKFPEILKHYYPQAVVAVSKL